MTHSQRVPSAAGDATVRQFFCGPESFTPDLSPLVGEAPELRNFFVAAGLNSLGILQGGGIGRLDRQLDRGRAARSGRCRASHRPIPELIRRTGPIGGIERPRSSARCTRCTSRTNRTRRRATSSGISCTIALRMQGAFFVQSAGWEIAHWYAPPGHEAKVERYSWKRQNWFEYAAKSTAPVVKT